MRFAGPLVRHAAGEVITGSLDCAAQLTKSAEKTKSAGQAMIDKWAGFVLGECDERLYSDMFGPGRTATQAPARTWSRRSSRRSRDALPNGDEQAAALRAPGDSGDSAP